MRIEGSILRVFAGALARSVWAYLVIIGTLLTLVLIPRNWYPYPRAQELPFTASDCCDRVERVERISFRIMRDVCAKSTVLA